MKDNKKFYVITKDNSHEYDITVEETDTGRTFRLYYSKMDEWTCPGDLIMTIKEKDIDSSVDLPKKLGKNIDASQVNELSLLLKFAVLYGQKNFKEQLIYDVVPVEVEYTI